MARMRRNVTYRGRMAGDQPRLGSSRCAAKRAAPRATVDPSVGAVHRRTSRRCVVGHVRAHGRRACPHGPRLHRIESARSLRHAVLAQPRVVVHVHDLPVASSDGTKLGFGLWNYREVALLVEGGIFVIATVVWWQRRDNRRARTALMLCAMTALLVASFYIPAPPTPAMMALTGLATYAGCAFAAWWAMLAPRARVS